MTVALHSSEIVIQYILGYLTTKLCSLIVKNILVPKLHRNMRGFTAVFVSVRNFCDHITISISFSLIIKAKV